MKTKIKAFFKKLCHRHKYTNLLVYPPKSEIYEGYDDHKTYGFLKECACGKVERVSLRGIEKYTMVFPNQDAVDKFYGKKDRK